MTDTGISNSMGAILLVVMVVILSLILLGLFTFSGEQTSTEGVIVNDDGTQNVSVNVLNMGSADRIEVKYNNQSLFLEEPGSQKVVLNRSNIDESGGNYIEIYGYKDNSRSLLRRHSISSETVNNVLNRVKVRINIKKIQHNYYQLSGENSSSRNGRITQYFWSSNNSTIGAGENIKIAAPANQKMSIKLRVENNKGKEGIASTEISKSGILTVCKDSSSIKCLDNIPSYYNKIQNAANNFSSSYSKIIVYEGTYSESVNLNGGTTLEGISRNEVIINPQGRDGIKSQNSNIKIKNLTIENAKAGYQQEGYYYGGNNININNIRILDSSTGIRTWTYGPQGDLTVTDSVIGVIM